ncbi:MAG TPA: tetratricopeptide repeat protein [Chitinophagales bacterium]|nr:tetratricopeptide repeat protein [Chitinophagales bacterium]HRP39517.1 tetratricopeptide repeat protein [Chitinophagales bacterium]
MSTETNVAEPSFKISYATAILTLAILIPIVYIVATNLSSSAAPQQQEVTQNQNITTAASGIEPALKAAESNPNYETYLNLGLAYYNAANYLESVSAWEKALEYNPQSAVAYNNIAAAYGALEMWNEEIAACEKALAIDPNMALAKNNLEWAKKMKAESGK